MDEKVIKKDNGDEIYDPQDQNEEEAFVSFDIATYPSDLTLSVISEMFKNKEIEIPDFQRHFVWTIKQSSLLIESFLMGLPVPQVFVYVTENNKNLVIDGQQRILSVIYFFEGYFGTENVSGSRKVFRLTGLSPENPYYNKMYKELPESDQRKLRSSILRFMNIKQLNPQKDNTSIYHIFERLNTGGTPLKPQEIRNVVYRGNLVNELSELNKNENWRKIIGKSEIDKNQKDVELILRVFALYKDWPNYEKPMKEFLNSAMASEKDADSQKFDEFKEVFLKTIQMIYNNIGDKPFHIRRPLNASALDSILCVLMELNISYEQSEFQQKFNNLLRDDMFDEKITHSSSDEKVLKERFNIVKEYFQNGS